MPESEQNLDYRDAPALLIVFCVVSVRVCFILGSFRHERRKAFVRRSSLDTQFHPKHHCSCLLPFFGSKKLLAIPTSTSIYVQPRGDLTATIATNLKLEHSPKLVDTSTDVLFIVAKWGSDGDGVSVQVRLHGTYIS